ncbi:hypothetical protein [Maricaulis parjimensis]|uniref:hypothetical protein n=1 Tax=Maricaulis parjimensis TaxID=144023 RepID=UPI00193A1E87|nr:hypothetical protein [Maricaulis parjimensis]
MKTRFKLALAAVPLLLAPIATAQDDASPEGQVYAVSFGDSPPVSGLTVVYTFVPGGEISSQAPRGSYDGYGDPGGSGMWHAEGMVLIQGNSNDGLGEAPEFGTHPDMHLQLLAPGQAEVMCQSWPQIAVGESADPQSLCWITNPNVTAVVRQQ